MNVILEVPNNDINKIKELPPYTKDVLPECEKKINKMFNISLLPCITSKNKFLKYV